MPPDAERKLDQCHYVQALFVVLSQLFSATDFYYSWGVEL